MVSLIAYSLLMSLRCSKVVGKTKKKKQIQKPANQGNLDLAYELLLLVWVNEKHSAADREDWIGILLPASNERVVTWAAANSALSYCNISIERGPLHIR
jgi:hypothetical protein